MLPSVLSHELMKGVRAFLRATFPPSTPEFRAAFDAILDGVGREGDTSKQMTEDGVITCRQEMQKSPPDILMTNYKMLD